MRKRSVLAACLSFAVSISLVAVPAQAATYVPPGVQKDLVTPSHRAAAPKPALTKRIPAAIRKPVWPRAGVAEVVLPTGRERQLGLDGPVSVSGMPVKVTSSASRMRVRMFDREATRAAGVEGVLIGLSRADGIPAKGSARVTLSYKDFATAYGADWSSRLRLVQLPQRTVVPTTNDSAAQTLTATVEMSTGDTLFAAEAGAAGGAGDFGATTLSASATWTGGGSSGGFSWNYPLRTPPSNGGPAPSLALSYSSQSVDGRMAASNNQPSVLGEGFEMSTGFIERRYKSCEGSGELCWATDNATLSLAGHAGELLKDPSTPDRWRLRSDDGTYVRHVTGATDWWIVTTSDGTQFWFGGRAGSNSTWQVPVDGVLKPWRWNLDHVVDQHGNTMSLQYTKEPNKYATAGGLVDYDRGGYLNRIDYGTRTGSSATAPMNVEFTYADRCFSFCAGNENWPDTPRDLECLGSSCNNASPSFWTSKRLASVTTNLWSGSAPTPVTTWTFTHSFRDPGDGTRAGLILEKISQTGHVRVTSTVPDVTFDYIQMNNRVNPLWIPDHSPAMNWFRVNKIESESGGEIAVTYSTKDCYPGRMPDPNALQDNNLRCYPVRWQPSGHPQPLWDFFHKYVVTEIHETDTVTLNNPAVVHTYEYVGDPAWHYTDDDGIVKAENKTWSGWRGYGKVRTKTGTGSAQTMSETRYFRGMHGDTLPSGTRSVLIDGIADEEAFAGMARESTVYNGPTGGEVSSEVTTPWQSAPTATRTINNTTVYARYSGVQETRGRVIRDQGRPARITSSATVFDSFGMPIEQENRGDESIPGDESCTLTDYNRNTDPAEWIIGLAKRVRQSATTCVRAKQTGLIKDEVVSDQRVYYDNATSVDTAPTRGLGTKAEGLEALPAVYMTVSTSEFDALGRVVKSTSAKGVETLTAYTNNAGGQLETRQVTTLGDWVTTTKLLPAFGSTLTQTDPNGRVTSLEYDGLGRVTSIWRPGRDYPSQPANELFEYHVSRDVPTFIKSSKALPTTGYVTTYALFDGLLRPLQTQAPSADGLPQILTTDNFYDSTGRVWKTYPGYVRPGTPNGSYDVGNEGSLPARTENTFDGAGRTTLSIRYVKPGTSDPVVEHSRVVTTYGGDRVDVTPPVGGTATSTFTNAQGQKAELWQHKGAGTYDVTSYLYTAKGQLSKVIDSAGKEWTSEYDLRGNKVKATDPDAGTSTMGYNKYGELEYTIDPRQIRLDYAYDSIGRKKTVHQGTTKRAEWIYDSLLNSRGQLTKSIRYENGSAYTREVTGFHASYQPIGMRYTIPNTEGLADNPINYGFTYYSSGAPESMQMPDIDGAGGMTPEKLTFEYTPLGQPKKLKTNLDTGSTYVADTKYTGYGEVSETTLQNAGSGAITLTRQYQEGTRLLVKSLTSRTAAPTNVFDLNYTYDQAGGITKISETVNGDHQCFQDDALDRLKQAWTPLNGDCNAAPSLNALGGPAKYWTSWQFDVNGNRFKQIENVAPNGTRTTTYNYPNEPHRLKSTSISDLGGTTTRTWDYDPGGYVKTRDSQPITWDAEGHVATEGTTKFRYDADGARLIREDAGVKTLYLPGQEVRLTGTVKKTVRYYSHAGAQVAMRTTGGITWLAGDHQGTMSVSIKASDQSISVRRQDPYGNARTGTGTWSSLMDKGFVGGTQDTAGLTHLGAREYDPSVGQFISVDPLFIADDPQQFNGYQYGAHNPVSKSDPDGTCVLDEETGECDHKLTRDNRAIAQAAVVKAKKVDDALRKYWADRTGITKELNPFECQARIGVECNPFDFSQQMRADCAQVSTKILKSCYEDSPDAWVYQPTDAEYKSVLALNGALDAAFDAAGFTRKDLLDASALGAHNRSTILKANQKATEKSTTQEVAGKVLVTLVDITLTGAAGTICFFTAGLGCVAAIGGAIAFAGAIECSMEGTGWSECGVDIAIDIAKELAFR